MSDADIGMIGLGVMGQNLARNMARHGYVVAGLDRDAEKVAAWTASAGKGERLVGVHSLDELTASLKKPRRYMMMVPAGKPVDSVIEELLPHLDKDDILIDGGNSHFEETTRRTRMLEEKGFQFIGTGVSGGEEGALNGPSLMPGGSPGAWPHVKPILQAIAAKVDDGSPCCQWVGGEGAGHFVKMVHNGIEYGDMQMICEAYLLLKEALGLEPPELHRIFADWNAGELNSYLIEITARIFTVKDDDGSYLVDHILDTAGQKGTGKWTSIVALDQGIAAPTIAEAVFARCLSAIKEERVEAAADLRGPEEHFSGDRDAFIEQVRQALFASKICSYAQGFALMKSASDEWGWDLQFGDISLLWREGCIIRAGFLKNIKTAFDQNPALPNLLQDAFFRKAIHGNQGGWRNAVAEAVRLGIPTPAFSSALAYYDGYRSARLPANLLQAQRDFFGAHTYERIDRPRGEFFHTDWNAESSA